MAKSKRYEARLDEYKRLAKKADAQLRSLERAFQMAEGAQKTLEKYEESVRTGKWEKGQIRFNKKQLELTKKRAAQYSKYAILKDYAYGTALNDIKRLYGSGKRFNRSIPEGMKLEDINKRIDAITAFLNKPSAYLRSTKEHESYPAALKRSAAAFSDALTKKVGRKVSLSADQIGELLNMADEYDLINSVGKYEFLEAVYAYQDNKAFQEAIQSIEGINKDDYNVNDLATELKLRFMDEQRKTKGKTPKFTKKLQATSQVLASLIASGVDMSQFTDII